MNWIGNKILPWDRGGFPKTDWQEGRAGLQTEEKRRDGGGAHELL